MKFLIGLKRFMGRPSRIISILIYFLLFDNNSLCIKIEENSRIVKDVIRKFQGQCIYLLKPKYNLDLRIQLISRKYFSEFAKDFFISSVIQDELKTSSTMEICQPFIFAYSNWNYSQDILKMFTGTSYRANVKLTVFEDSLTNENKFFEDSYIPLDSEFLMVKRSARSAEVTIHEFYNILPNTSLQMQCIATWNPNKGLKWTNESYSVRRNNLHGTTIKVGTISFGKILTVLKSKDGIKPIKIGGFVSQVWDALSKRLNFISDFRGVPDGAYGSRDVNGTWNGLIGMVARREVDIGLMSFGMNSARWTVNDYFTPIIKSKYSIFIKESQEEGSSLDQLVKPLSANLWYSTIVVLFLFSAVFTITWSFSGIIDKQNSGPKYVIGNSIFYMFGIFCQRGLDLSPRSNPSRLVYINANMFALVIFGAYSAILYAFLAVSKYEIAIKDIKDLIEDGRYKLGLLANSAHFTLFGETTDPLLKEAYQKLVLAEKNHPKRNEIGLRRVCEEYKFAYFMINLFEKQVAPELSCSVVEIPKTFFPATLAMTCTKNSTLRRLINYYIIKMYEGGLLKINEARLVPLKGQIKIEEVTIVAGMEKMIMVFIIFIIGVISSLIILILEICVSIFKF